VNEAESRGIDFAGAVMVAINVFMEGFAEA
jgi:hypothetical protein